MGDIALPYILPRVVDPRLETIKFVNFLSALSDRRNSESKVSHSPIDATIDLTTTCQLKCPYCAVGNGTMERPSALMKPERHQHIMAGIGDEVFIVWYFSTGEPLLHEQFSSIISSSKHQGIFSSISTNLSLPLSDERIDELLRSGLGMISVSLDGATEQSYSRYRVGGKFDLVLNNMRRLIERKRELGLEFPLIEWRFLRFRHNQHEEQLAREMARALSVDLIEFFSGYAPATATADEVQVANIPLNGAPVEGPALDKAIGGHRGLLDQYLSDAPLSYGLPNARTNDRKCDWLYFGTMIYPDGAVGPCCVATDKKDDFTNVDDHPTFADAWNAPKFMKARELFANDTLSGTICDRCPMPDAQTYQFGQKLRGMLRIAPPWVLSVLDAAPDKFFLEIDRLLMPQEVGPIWSGQLRERFPELRDEPPAIPEFSDLKIARPVEDLLTELKNRKKEGVPVLNQDSTIRIGTPEQYQFMKENVHRIDGWLEDYTALRTMDLLEWQFKRQCRGPLLEIGVFAGRYFSILARATEQFNDRLVGIDTFQWISEETVRANIANLDRGQIRLIKKSTTDMTAEDILVELNGPVRFISVDGSHEAVDVLHDLEMAEKIISDSGIIAADDFLNPLTLGVNEAINKFFFTPRRVTPFAYIANKLFLCRPEMAQELREFVEGVARIDTVEPRSKTFREEAAKGRHFVEATMWGQKFLIIP